jgi:uncharacterized pyridoxamine 5'-phosphate oxidase family protein
MLGANLTVEYAVVSPGLLESCSHVMHVVFYTEELVYFPTGNNKKNYTIITQFTTRMSVRRARLL